MAYKDILVVTDATSAGNARMATAAALAARFDAHLTGLFVMTPPIIPTYAAAEIPQAVFEIQREAAEADAATARKAFDAAVKASGARAEWRVAESTVIEAATISARYADLVVVGQGDPETGFAAGVDPQLAGDLAIHAGRPVLVTPYAPAQKTIGKRVLVAWNASRESARAVADAMPFLTSASHVVTLSVNAESGQRAGTHGADPGADIALHLARHGVKVQAAHTIAPDIDPSDALLNRASDDAIDLIVMGAYGHTRLREMVLGGVTRDMLATSPVALLLSH